MSQEESEETIFQPCFWYGIHYPYELSEQIAAVLAESEKYKGLSDDRECAIEGVTYYRNSNSDIDPSHGCVFPSHMSKTGDDFDNAQYCTLDFSISELEEIEDQNQPSMEIIDDIWQLLRKNIPALCDQIQVGWRSYICEYVKD